MVEKIVKQALSSIAEFPKGYAILDLDVEYFCASAINKHSKSIEATKCLIEVFCDTKQELTSRIHAGVLCLDIFKQGLVPVQQDVSSAFMLQICSFQNKYSTLTANTKG